MYDGYREDGLMLVGNGTEGNKNKCCGTATLFEFASGWVCLGIGMFELVSLSQLGIMYIVALGSPANLDADISAAFDMLDETLIHRADGLYALGCRELDVVGFGDTKWPLRAPSG